MTRPAIEFLKVIESLCEGVIVYDSAGRVLHFNQSALEVLGLTADELEGSAQLQAGWAMLRADLTPLPHDEVPSVEARLTRRPVHRRRLTVRSPRGDHRELVVTALPMFSQTGELEQVVSAFLDVTREQSLAGQLRVEEQRQVSRSRELLSEAFELAELAVIERHLGETTAHLTSRLCELLQLEADAPPVATLDRFITPIDLPRYHGYLAQLGDPTPRPPLQLRLRTARGETREVRLWARRSGDDPARARELVVIQDVTQQSLLQAKLRLAERLTSLGTMAAGVAHEINNPLSFVLANLNVVKNELATFPPLPGVDLVDLRAAVSEALEGAERVRQIVLGLKPFARVDEHQRGQCDIARIVEASLKMAKNELRHRARIVKDLKPVAPVFANEARLGEVFLNLLMNAAQSIPDGHAAENLVTVALREEKGQVVIVVSDTGCGIPAEVLPRIFDPFFSTKQIGAGTGLGLFISQGIVQDAGGVISVVSAPGRGSTFEVRLPVALGMYEGTATTPLPARRRARLLLVDDEPSILRSLQRLLGKAHDLTLAHSGREALALLSAGLEYDLVLCDLMMPEVSGIDVWEQLTAPQRQIFVFMTGGTFTERAERFLASAKPPVLEKPFTATTLEGLLQRAR